MMRRWRRGAITNCFDALRIGLDPEGEMRPDESPAGRPHPDGGGRQAAGRSLHPPALRSFRAGLHGVLCGCSTSDDRVKLASLMDHAPRSAAVRASRGLNQIYYMGKLKDVGGTSSAPSAKKRIAGSEKNSGCRTAKVRGGRPVRKGIIYLWPAMTTPRSTMSRKPWRRACACRIPDDDPLGSRIQKGGAWRF